MLDKICRFLLKMYTFYSVCIHGVMWYIFVWEYKIPGRQDRNRAHSQFFRVQKRKNIEKNRCGKILFKQKLQLTFFNGMNIRLLLEIR